MIEYTHKVLAIDLKRSTIQVELMPQNQAHATSLFVSVFIGPTRLQEIITQPTQALMFAEVRKEIIKGNDGYQADWETEIATKSTPIPAELMAGVGQEFAVVTEAEITALGD
ncbi:hypothetical protein NO559_07830 [Dasania sp. GY-MA-18]|uniref:Uncharacterized protein n=1 Tax=Dasania phycosphaerae TaxID=2950436 RepID=A0A9J6RL97_9GAMM|nr:MULTISPECIES: hypothetical protein [Dasania]MCR8922675.1 hypothetical protein [Dasania sp. GY-MA-18]MCZ0865105.1 hypothetical protein [Dasania phycosphaerae]MCZ0868831.1 hypothetical protein [Dasania phycosphaerae]